MRFGERATVVVALLFVSTSATSHAADTGPVFSANSIVNAATQTVEALAPNTIATLYGSNLAFDTYSAAGYAPGATLPNTLGGVSVLVMGTPAKLFFVSPGQINFLIPYELVPGTVSIAVARQGLAGAPVDVKLNSTSPGLFPIPVANSQMSNAIATHLSGALVSADAPAKAGEIIVLYAAGLGRVNPDTTSGKLVTSAAQILAAPQMQLTLGGVAIPAANVLYAGLAPGFAGLYQINLKLPDTLVANPEIRIAIAGQTSQGQVQLPAIGNAPPISSPNLP